MLMSQFFISLLATEYSLHTGEDPQQLKPTLVKLQQVPDACLAVITCNCKKNRCQNKGCKCRLYFTVFIALQLNLHFAVLLGSFLILFLILSPSSFFTAFIFIDHTLCISEGSNFDIKDQSLVQNIIGDMLWYIQVC